MSASTIDFLLNETDEEKARGLSIQTAAIERMSVDSIERQGAVLAEAEKAASDRSRRVIEHMDRLHREFNEMVRTRLEAGALDEKSYARYLTQAWYHTRYTPDFERMFAKRLAEYIVRSGSEGVASTGNKFVRLIEEGADEELGHELWALEDLKRMEVIDEIDERVDVFPECRALVRTQFDRLDRLNFKGFLGYSFYLEFWVAKYAGAQLELLGSLGVDRSNTSFLYNHYVVDQGHAADNIELLDFVLETDADVEEVIDNMNMVHALYSRMVEKCFQ